MTRTVCFVNTNRAFGGGERFAAEHAGLCSKHGLDVHVVVHDQCEWAGRLTGYGVTIHRIHLKNLSFLNPLKILSIRRLLKTIRADTVLFTLPRDLKAAGFAAWWAGIPRRIYRRGIAVPVKNTSLNRLLYSRVLTRLIANSNETLRCVRAHNPSMIADDSTRLIHNGFDLKAWDAIDAPPLPPSSVPVIGNAARLTGQKGQIRLVEAARLLKDRGHDFVIRMAGTGPDEAALRERVRTLEIEDRVEFLGFVENIKQFYSSIDIFAFPSLWEGFGYALVEAMACKKPVVACNVSSNPEVVGDGATGLLVNPDDAESLAAGLERLLTDSGLCAAFGAAGRARVAERFAMDRTFPKFIEALS